MKDESNRYKNLDEKFRLAAAEIPVEFDASTWEKLSVQLDNAGGIDLNDSSGSGTTSEVGKQWLKGINFNTVFILILESIAFMILVNVVISVMSNAQIPERKFQDETIKTAPIILKEIPNKNAPIKSLELIPIEDDKSIKEKKSTKHSIVIKKDSVILKRDSIREDSLHIFW